MSDTMFARSRLRAHPWAAARFTLLGILTVLTIGVFHFTPVPGAQTPTHLHVSIPRFFLIPAPTERPPQPSAFDEESAMGPKALIDRWQPFIAEASQKFHVPQSWIRAVIRQESGGRTMMGENQPITSTAGAMGVMQVEPDTYAEMRDIYDLGTDPNDPHDNIIAGTAYLRWLHGKYGFPNMFAAYNDGPGNFDQVLAGKRTMPAETVSYLSDLSAALGPAKSGRQRTQPA